MNDGTEETESRATAIASLLVLGLGLTALFTGQSWFWLVFVIGFAVVVPLVAVLTGESSEGESGGEDANTSTRAPDADSDAESKTDALRILRERYARGELSEEQFEAKLDRLLESETLEGIRERRDAERELER